MKDILVVFYSRTGTTRRLAHEIAVACRADLEEVRDVVPRGGIRGLVRSIADAVFHRVPDIRPVEYNPDDYVITVLGGPVWMGTLPSPLRAYILEYRRNFHDVAIYCTARGAFADRMLRNIAVLCRRRPVIRMTFPSSMVRDEHHEPDAAEFAAAIRDHVTNLKARREAARRQAAPWADEGSR